MQQETRTSWLLGVASIVFDIDVGQRVDALVPAGALTPAEQSSVAFHSFPDSMSMELHAKTSIRDSSFWFRVKRQPCTGVPSYIYGFVFCRQRQDATLPRGGEQMSVVCLSAHPFTTVLRPLSQVAGNLFFSMGKAALEQVYNEVCNWPAPTSGPLLQLQVGYSMLSCRLPAFNTLPHPSCCTAVDAGPPPSSRNHSRTVSRSTSVMDGVSVRSPSGIQQGSLSAAMDQLNLSRPSQSQVHEGPSSQNQVRSPSPSNAGTLVDIRPSAFLLDKSNGAAEMSESLGLQVSGEADGSAVVQAGAGTSGRLGRQPGSLGASGALLNSAGSLGSASSLTSMEQPAGHNLASVSTGGAEGPSSGNLVPGTPTVNMSGTGLPRRISLGISDSPGTLTGPFTDSDIFTPFAPQLNKLWHLFEMVLLGKPMLVVGPSPADCAGAVSGLLSLIAPLPFAPDFRPYYTIHDETFAALANGMLPGPETSVPCLLGITNLYFVRALGNWPNILSVGRKDPSTWPANNPAPSSSWLPNIGTGSASSTTGSSMFTPSGAVKALRQRTQGAQALLSGHIESLWSTYKPVLKPDQALLLRLLQPKPGDIKSKVQRIAYVNGEAIRRHFLDMMNALLAPFARYLEPGPDGTVPAWDASEFLFLLRTAPAHRHPPVLLERVGGTPANLVELYARFLVSPNFRAWFSLARAPLMHLVKIAGLDVPTAALPAPSGPKGLAWFAEAKKHMDEVELVNLFFNLEQQLRDALGEADAADATDEAHATVLRLEHELVTLFLGIGQVDLQLLCVSAPQRRELLLASAARAAVPEQRVAIEELCKQLQ